MLQMDKLKIGALVRWQEPYDDDPDIIRDAGTGILLDIKDREGPLAAKNSKLFCVYRNAHADIMTTTETYVCLLK